MSTLLHDVLTFIRSLRGVAEILYIIFLTTMSEIKSLSQIILITPTHSYLTQVDILDEIRFTIILLARRPEMLSPAFSA